MSGKNSGPADLPTTRSRTLCPGVGESITFSAATVIASLLTLLLAVFGLYSSLGAPLAIAIGLMLLAGLTLTPALLAIFGRAAFWPSNTTQPAPRLGWWGRTAGRIVTHPTATLALGLVLFGAGHGRPRLHAGRFRQHPGRPPRLGLRRRQRAARRPLPGRQQQPDPRAAALPHTSLERLGTGCPR